MGGNARRAMLCHVRDKGVALLGIRTREHGAAFGQPLDAGHAVQRGAIDIPAGRIGAAEAVELLLRQAQVFGTDLDIESTTSMS